jgi:putative redox protein
MKYLLENPVVGTTGTEKFRAHIRWRNGVLITDEPEKLGGKDTGPDPYTLLLASLVSCTMATLRMYIDHKGLDIPNIGVEANLFHRLESEGPVVHIERRIAIGDLQDTAIQDRLIRVAENCPISKILKGNIKIMTAFKESMPLL